MGLRFCASGDLMLIDRFPENYDYKSISCALEKVDVKITNLESVISDGKCFASAFCGGQWITIEPDKLDEIQKYGFNLYSCANNHSMDFSYEGVLSTKRELEKNKLLYAGIGTDLDEASKPVLFKKANKDSIVAFISVTTTFIDAARAGGKRGDMPGRPGVNCLRIKTVYNVNEQHFNALKEIAAATYINGERDNARKIGSLPPEAENCFNFGGIFFQQSECENKFTYCDERDLVRIQNEIKKAKRLADYVVISVHSHQIKRNKYFEPDYFLEEFSHKCIDAGASAIIGGGTHQLKPIEIYKDKPIFYSLGNFVFQLHKIKTLPDDFWDKYNYPKELSVIEAINIRNKNGTIGLERDELNYLSVIPFFEYNDDKVCNLYLVPLELGFDCGNEFKGLPTIASKEKAQFITNYLNKISADYGTKFVYENRKISVMW
ncbi:MAG: CapA family protein [Clostridiaceae bacterium]|nr:CapA family protein [Clostridiaceae bacterium]